MRRNTNGPNDIKEMIQVDLDLLAEFTIGTVASDDVRLLAAFRRANYCPQLPSETKVYRICLRGRGKLANVLAHQHETVKRFDAGSVEQEFIKILSCSSRADIYFLLPTPEQHSFFAAFQEVAYDICTSGRNSIPRSDWFLSRSKNYAPEAFNRFDDFFQDDTLVLPIMPWLEKGQGVDKFISNAFPATTGLQIYNYASLKICEQVLNSALLYERRFRQARLHYIYNETTYHFASFVCVGDTVRIDVNARISGRMDWSSRLELVQMLR